jgi:hypothetical protein
MVEVPQSILEEWVKKGLLDPSALTSSTQMESSPSPPKSPQESLPLPSKCNSTSKENKTEQAARRYLRELGFQGIEREKIKIRLGPEGQRCWYTPDFFAMHYGSMCLIEVKGGFERDDARVKRMACAEWCEGVGMKFLFMQWKGKVWKNEWLA